MADVNIEELYEKYVKKFSPQERIQLILEYLEQNEKHFHYLETIADLIENGDLGLSKVFDEFLMQFNFMPVVKSQV